MNYLRTWLSLAKISIIREMEFRTNFVLGIVRQLLWLFTFLFSISIIFSHTHSLRGWTQAQVIVILALSRIFEGIMDIIVSRNIAEFPGFVQKGTFDYVLLKPLPAQLMMAFRTVNIYIIGNVVAGIILLTTVLVSGSISISWEQLALFLWVGSMGMITFYSLLVGTASIVFFLERLEALWGLMNLYTEPLTVPMEVFPRTPRFILTYLLPVAFIVFVPAQAIVGKISWETGLLATVVAAITFTVANTIWRVGIRKYTSASS